MAISALISKMNNENKKYNSCLFEISPITALSARTLKINRIKIVHSTPLPVRPTFRKIINKKNIPVIKVNF